MWTTPGSSAPGAEGLERSVGAPGTTGARDLYPGPEKGIYETGNAKGRWRVFHPYGKYVTIEG